MSLQLLKNTRWLKTNEESLKALFPRTWTHSANINWMQVRFKLKLIGIDYRSEDDIAKILTFFTRIGIVEIRNMTDDTAQMRRSTVPLNI